MNIFNEIVFYIALVVTALAGSAILVIQMKKDQADINARRFAKWSIALGILLIIISIGTGVNAHLDANEQEDSSIKYRSRYDSLVHNNLDSSHKIIDSTNRLLVTTDSILKKNTAIIKVQDTLLTFEDSTRQQLNKQIGITKDALANATNQILDFQQGKNSYCYVEPETSISFKDIGGIKKDVRDVEFILRGSGTAEIDDLHVHVVDNGTIAEHEALPRNNPLFFRLTPFYQHIERIVNPSALTNMIGFSLYNGKPLGLDSTREYLYTITLQSARQLTEEHLRLKYITLGWDYAYELKVSGMKKKIIRYSYGYPDKDTSQFKYFKDLDPLISITN